MKYAFVSIVIFITIASAMASTSDCVMKHHDTTPVSKDLSCHQDNQAEPSYWCECDECGQHLVPNIYLASKKAKAYLSALLKPTDYLIFIGFSSPPPIF